MELKRQFNRTMTLVLILLIVPYGIETHVQRDISPEFTTLLIVPYGIETSSL